MLLYFIDFQTGLKAEQKRKDKKKRERITHKKNVEGIEGCGLVQDMMRILLEY